MALGRGPENWGVPPMSRLSSSVKLDAVCSLRGQHKRGGPKVSGALFEREAATSAIATALDAVRRGGHSALFIQGEAGLGKTSLIVEARAARPAVCGWAGARASPRRRRSPSGSWARPWAPLGALSELETVSDLASGETRCQRLLPLHT